MCLLVLLVFLGIEWKHPYFFLQDDNRDGSLPQFVQCFRSASLGQVPLYNYYQFLGTPSLAACSNAGLYPPMYVAGMFSRLIFKDFFRLFEILALLHLLLAGVGMFRLLKRFHCSPWARAAAGLSWALCSFSVYVGSAWWMFPAYAGALPWALLTVWDYFSCPSPVRLISAALVKLWMWTIGFPELFVYTFVFEAVFIGISWILAEAECLKHSAGSRLTHLASAAYRFLRAYVIYVLAAFITVLPLLLPVWELLQSVEKRSGRLPWHVFSSGGYEFWAWLQAKLLPFWNNPLLPIAWRQDKIGHIGYLALVGLAFGFWVVLCAKSKLRKPALRFLVSALAAAVLALLWALNLPPLQECLYRVPILNRFRLHFRLELFSAFFLILFAGKGLSILVRRTESRLGAKAAAVGKLLLLIGVAVNFSALFLWLPPQAFEQHSDKVPWSEPLRDVLADGRIISLGYCSIHGLQGRTASSLGWNYPMLWGLVHLAGYDVLLPRENAEATLGINGDQGYFKTFVPHDYLRQWGVKYYIVNPRTRFRLDPGLQLIHADSDRQVFLDPQASPLFFLDAPGVEGRAHGRIEGNCLDIVTEGAVAADLVCAFLRHRNMVAFVDGRRVGWIDDTRSRIRVAVPAGRHHVQVEYREPGIRRGLWIAISCWILGLLVFWALLKRRKRL